MHVVSDLEISIQNLSSSTRYYVRFRANTQIGGGNYSEKRGFFTNGSKYHLHFLFIDFAL